MKIMAKSIIAGAMIAIGSIIYVKLNNWIGAVAFSVGLLSILQYEYKLYTGYVAYIDDKDYLKNVVLILIGNIIGCCVLFLLPKFAPATIIWTTKIEKTVLEKIIYSFFCGMLIFLGTNEYKKCGPILTIFCVTGFILCGAEHSIANTCYMIMARDFQLQSFITIGIEILGNAAGAITLYGIKNLTKS